MVKDTICRDGEAKISRSRSQSAFSPGWATRASATEAIISLSMVASAFSVTLMVRLS